MSHLWMFVILSKLLPKNPTAWWGMGPATMHLLRNDNKVKLLKKILGELEAIEAK